MFSMGGLRRIVNLRVSFVKLSPSNPPYALTILRNVGDIVLAFLRVLNLEMILLDTLILL